MLTCLNLIRRLHTHIIHTTQSHDTSDSSHRELLEISMDVGYRKQQQQQHGTYTPAQQQHGLHIPAQQQQTTHTPAQHEFLKPPSQHVHIAATPAHTTSRTLHIPTTITTPTTTTHIIPSSIPQRTMYIPREMTLSQVDATPVSQQHDMPMSSQQHDMIPDSSQRMPLSQPHQYNMSSSQSHMTRDNMSQSQGYMTRDNMSQHMTPSPPRHDDTNKRLLFDETEDSPREQQVGYDASDMT